MLSQCVLIEHVWAPVPLAIHVLSIELAEQRCETGGKIEVLHWGSHTNKCGHPWFPIRKIYENHDFCRSVGFPHLC